MYPVSRLAILAARARVARPLKPDGLSEIDFRCRPWDLDMFLEMNNGRVLTLYDLGRFDLILRCGLWRMMRRKRWGLAVAGSSVRYRKPVRLFDKVIMRTKLAGFDDRWIYIAQSMRLEDTPSSSVVLRTCLVSNNKSVPTEEVLTAMGLTGWRPEMPQWVSAWEQADMLRPWPPDP